MMRTVCHLLAACHAGGNNVIQDQAGGSTITVDLKMRDGVVTEAWEGGHNVLCAQALRDASRLKLHEPIFAMLREHATSSEVT